MSMTWITGTVYWGQPMNALRRDVVNRYRNSHGWLWRGDFPAPWHVPTDDTHPMFAPRWTKYERAAFRKWRAEFMRGADGGRKKTKKKSRQKKV